MWIEQVGLFIVGVAILVYPIKKLLDAARNYMNNSYYKSQDANREIQRVVENMFLIKILKKDVYEMERFENLFLVCLKLVNELQGLIGEWFLT